MDNLNLLFGLKTMKTNSVLNEKTSGTAVIYTSNHGTANKVAWRISELITDGDITLVDLKHQKSPELNHYKRIIIVGSVLSGKIQNEVEIFCAVNEQILLKKDLGLYLCCMPQDEQAIKQFNESFSEILRKHASSCAIMGYEFYSNRSESGEYFVKGLATGYSEYNPLINRRQLNRIVSEMQN